MPMSRLCDCIRLCIILADVKVLRATGIKAVSGRGLLSPKTSSPYVALHFGDQHPLRSSTKKNELHPAWDEGFGFLVFQGEQHVRHLTLTLHGNFDIILDRFPRIA